MAARKGSPIAIGVGNGETIVASDVSAIINYTKQVVFLNDEDIATITAEGLDISSLKNGMNGALALAKFCKTKAKILAA